MFAFFQFIGPQEILMLIVLGVLLFGRKLPEIGRSLGKTVVEFKKGIRGLEEEVEQGNMASNRSEPAAEAPRPPQRVSSSAPKFEDDGSRPMG